MKKTNHLLFIALSLFVTACVFLLVNYLAVTFCVGNLGLFTMLVLVVPILCIAIVSFVIGYRIKWTWKYGICIAIILTLLSWGASQMTVFMAGNMFDSLTAADEPHQDISENQNDELMDELYSELDKKAYEYMLEQGLISEGEEIYGGDKSIGNKDETGNTEDDTGNDSEIVSSEMYVGIQKSDPVTELIGNIITFLVAYGLSFTGYKIKSKKEIQEKRNSYD